MSAAIPPDDPGCSADADFPGKSLVTEQPKKSFGDQPNAEQARESQPADQPAAPSSDSGRSDRCAECDEPTEWGRLGRRPKYCRSCRPRRIPTRDLPAAPTEAHTSYCDPETLRLHTTVARYTPARPGDFVTTSLTEHLHLDWDGRIKHVDVVQTLCATRDLAGTYLFIHAEETKAARVRIRPTQDTCVLATPRIPLEEDRWAVPIKIAGDPLQEGEERTIRFRVSHKNFGTPTKFPFRHLRPVGTHTLRSLTMGLLLPTPGATVDKCRWPDLYAEPAVERSCDLRDSREVTVKWNEPIEPGIYGIRWDIHVPGRRRAR